MNKVINSHLEPYTLSPPIHAHRSYLTDYTITQNPIRNPLGSFCPGSVISLWFIKMWFFFVKWSISGGNCWKFRIFKPRRVLRLSLRNCCSNTNVGYCKHFAGWFPLVHLYLFSVFYSSNLRFTFSSLLLITKFDSPKLTARTPPNRRFQPHWHLIYYSLRNQKNWDTKL